MTPTQIREEIVASREPAINEERKRWLGDAVPSVEEIQRELVRAYARIDHLEIELGEADLNRRGPCHGCGCEAAGAHAGRRMDDCIVGNLLARAEQSDTLESMLRRGW